MPFVRRNAAGEIVAVSQTPGEGWTDEVATGDPALSRFLDSLQSGREGIESTDKGFIRVLEDLIDLLIDKQLISLGELPQDAQDKITRRRELRSQMHGSG